MLSSLSEYREFEPGPLLTGNVVCLWTQAIARDGCGYVQRVLPDGCVDIVWINDQPPMIVGPMTRPVFYPLAAGSWILGVRFFPGMSADVLRVPANHLADAEVPLRETWGGMAEELTAQLGESESLEGRVHALRAAMNCRCRGLEHDGLIAAAVNWLAHHPVGEVRHLAEWLGITPRHLHRRFCAAIGYGPKVFQRIMRFQRLLHLARDLTPTPEPLAVLAVEAGYADQAHMSREFQQIAHGTPAALLFRTSSALAMSDLFKT